MKKIAENHPGLLPACWHPAGEGDGCQSSPWRPGRIMEASSTPDRRQRVQFEAWSRNLLGGIRVPFCLHGEPSPGQSQHLQPAQRANHPGPPCGATQEVSFPRKRGWFPRNVFLAKFEKILPTEDLVCKHYPQAFVDRRFGTQESHEVKDSSAAAWSQKYAGVMKSKLACWSLKKLCPV